MFDARAQVRYILAMKPSRLLQVLLSSGAFLFFLLSCGSTSSVAEAVTTNEEPIVIVQKQEEPPAKEEKDEYAQSVGSLTVSKDTFEADKAEILSIIDKLSTIMHDFDYDSWLLYVDSQSKAYWSKPANLKKAQSKLPIKGLKLNTLQDYFKYVFVPARAGRSVSTLRYESDTYVKAVQINQPEQNGNPESYTVYYYFNKIDGHWELHLPEIED